MKLLRKLNIHLHKKLAYPDFRQHYEVKCICSWEGMLSQTKVAFLSDPADPTSVEVGSACPICGRLLV